MFTFNRSAVWEMHKTTISALHETKRQLDSAIEAENAAFDAHFNCEESDIPGTWEEYKKRTDARQAIEEKHEVLDNMRKALRTLMNEIDSLDDVSII